MRSVIVPRSGVLAKLAKRASILVPAIVHMSEGSYNLAPVKLINSSPSGLTFSNLGSDANTGGQFWFNGEGPFGQGFRTEGSNGSTTAVLCDQTIDVIKGMTHEGFYMGFDDSGRNIWELRENVANNPTWWITVAAVSQGAGTWTLYLDMKLPGYTRLQVQSSVFTAVTTGNGTWIVTQWNDDGTFELRAQGVRVLTTAVYDVALTSAKLAIFGSYRGTYAGGMYSQLIGELRFSKKAWYSGATVAVPTARFTYP